MLRACCIASACLVMLFLAAPAPSHMQPAAAWAAKHRSRGDIDGDGIPNRRDRDVDGDHIPNTRDRDIDGDRIPNDRDQDIDGDGVKNPWDYDSDSSGERPLANASLPITVPPKFLGVVADEAFWGTDQDADSSRTLSLIAGMGVGTLRQPFSWAMIEPRPGVYDFDMYDRFIEGTARQGRAVLPVLIDPPSFESSGPIPGDGKLYPPRSNESFASFAALLVHRYGPSGSFWREHPDVPAQPIRAWEVWNEPNIGSFWGSGPSPAAYSRMVKAVGGAIHAADPGARVVSAGLSGNERGVSPTRFLRGMYRAGAKGSFDAVSLHPYAPASDLVINKVRSVVRVLRRYHDRARVLITELGWASSGPGPTNLVVGPAGQAALVKATIPRLFRLRRPLRLDQVFYYSLRDARPAGAPDRWSYHTGLLTQDGSPKRGYWAWMRTVRGRTAG